MKKIVSLTLALVLTAALAMTSFATGGEITPPKHPDDYKIYNPVEYPETEGNNHIPGWGYIGPDAALTPDPDPDKKPDVDTDDVTKFLYVEVPTQFLWAAFQSDNGAVTAPTYKIINKNKQASLKVTMKSFEQTDGDSLPAGSTLTLNLIGDLALENVLGVAAQEHEYTSRLGAEQEWQFSFRGSYNGIFPVEYVQPKYEMVLGFEVDSINAQIEN